MSISVEMLVYNKEKIYQNFLNCTNLENNKSVRDKFDYVLRLHGIVVGDSYIILNNEYYEEYNLYYKLHRGLMLAFGFIDEDNYYDEEFDDSSIGFNMFSEVVLRDYKSKLSDECNYAEDIPYLIIDYLRAEIGDSKNK